MVDNKRTGEKRRKSRKKRNNNSYNIQYHPCTLTYTAVCNTIQILLVLISLRIGSAHGTVLLGCLLFAGHYTCVCALDTLIRWFVYTGRRLVIVKIDFFKYAFWVGVRWRLDVSELLWYGSTIDLSRSSFGWRWNVFNINLFRAGKYYITGPWYYSPVNR